MKVIKISLTDLSKKELPFQNEIGARGTWIVFKHMLELENVDSFMCSFNNGITFYDVKNNVETQYTCNELLDYLNTFDIVAIEIFKKPLEYSEYLFCFFEVLTKIKSVIYYQEHDFMPKPQRTFNSAYYGQLWKIVDYSSLYSDRNNYVKDIIYPQLNINKKSDSFYKGIAYINSAQFEKDIDESFCIEKNPYLVVENAAYDNFKGHEFLIHFTKYFKQFFSHEYKFIHIGLNFGMATYSDYFTPMVQTVGVENIERRNINTIKNYEIESDKQFLLYGPYAIDFIYEFLKRIKYTISLTTPKNPIMGKYVSGRFEIAQIEKCLFTLPIFEQGFIELFEDMDKVTKNAFLKFDILMPTKSTKKLKREIEYLNKNDNEYNDRRKLIIDYVKRTHDIHNYLNIMNDIHNKGKNSTYSTEEFLQDKDKITMKDWNLPISKFKKLFLNKEPGLF
jgi:hypothetical protein